MASIRVHGSMQLVQALPLPVNYETLLPCPVPGQDTKHSSSMKI